MAVTIDSAVKAGLIIAFIVPLFTYLSITMPAPIPLTGTAGTNATMINITQQYNATATYIRQHFEGTTTALFNITLPSNKVSGFFASPIEYEAFAFIFDGFGQMVQNIVQLPLLDYDAMHMIMLGMDAVLPSIMSTALVLGIALMESYILFSLLLTGIGMLMKYNPKNGAFIPFIPLSTIPLHGIPISHPIFTIIISIVACYTLLFILVKKQKKNNASAPHKEEAGNDIM